MTNHIDPRADTRGTKMDRSSIAGPAQVYECNLAHSKVIGFGQVVRSVLVFSAVEISGCRITDTRLEHSKTYHWCNLEGSRIFHSLIRNGFINHCWIERCDLHYPILINCTLSDITFDYEKMDVHISDIHWWMDVP